MRSGAVRAEALDRPDPAIRFYLFSGSDQSASRLNAERLLKGLDAEKVPTTGAQLKSNPQWLADEAASLSMFGERRLLWIEPAGEDCVPAVTALLALATAEAPAVAITSSSLKKDSGLKKLADSHPAAIHLASEPLGIRDQANAVMELARAAGLRVLPALAERVATEANGDLILARLELQKFAIYLGASSTEPKDLDDETVNALGIDQAEADYGRAGDVALAGDLNSLAEEMALLAGSGIEPIPVVRALQRRLLMLAPLLARVEQGQNIASVMQTVWRDKNAVARILPRWTASRLAEAFTRVQKLERELLLKPVPGQAALGELLVQLARAARR